ncbi:hypothetical protein J1605_004654 [Eschrichtius robustus]|uniref:Uncharacterized protein n=1 Tax=Eschrichtius robustus TaxID=9764 RepID=A0AB34HBK1_ESCRO|nr:hypothetical protein J1605_004654 [Eschrichtius robustus]
MPVPCKQQPELPSARAVVMSSSSPPLAGAASAAISASEKVDGFTRKSVRKAQRQKRSQGSSQFRSQGNQPELHPLPQLKGNLRGRSPGRNAEAPLHAASHFFISFWGFLLPSWGSECVSRVPMLPWRPPTPFDSNRFAVKSLASFLTSGFTSTLPVLEEVSTPPHLRARLPALATGTLLLRPEG